jgi:hypothetical protein
MAVVLRLPTIFAAKRFAVVRKWRVFFFFFFFKLKKLKILAKINQLETYLLN